MSNELFLKREEIYNWIVVRRYRPGTRLWLLHLQSNQERLYQIVAPGKLDNNNCLRVVSVKNPDGEQFMTLDVVNMPFFGAMP